MSTAPDFDVSILKPLWTRREDGRWAVHGAKGIKLAPRAGHEPDYFQFESDVELLSNSPPTNIGDFLSSFGSTNFLLKQSILPVVVWEQGAPSIRCIGTAFVVSCTGYVITACHVLTDPRERGYGKGTLRDTTVDKIEMHDGFLMGVLMPLAPGSGVKGFRVLQFEQGWYWGNWAESPLIHEKEKFEGVTDVAVCKLRQNQDGSAHQPLNLSLHPFVKGEKAYAIGYAEMEDIQVEYDNGQPKIVDFKWDLYVSVGEVVEVFPQNHLSKAIPAPGPSFDFRARIPGKMSGAPIFGAQGAVVRGVVSRSFSGEKHAFGSMIGPALTLPLSDGSSLKSKMNSGNEGMAVVMGQGL
ncbi:MAG: trypsin-like peptidase domain-containing protein [Rhizobiales bacterium]|nr:trypsin-like peptidase domain-containing protein [Hyphomicrobiales bacterium]